MTKTLDILETYGATEVKYIDPGYCAQMSVCGYPDYWVCEDTMEKVLERMFNVIKAEMWVMCE